MLSLPGQFNSKCQAVESHCEKIKIFMIMNRHASKLFKNILHDVQTEDNVEKITNMKICILIL